MVKRTLLLGMLMAVMSLSAMAVDTLYIRQTDTIVIRETRYKKVPVQQEATPAVVYAGSKEDCDDKVFFVYFPTGRYSLDDEAQKAIQQMAARLQDHPQMSLRLTGYCDYVGSSEVNERLSVARARVVGDQLVKIHGIAADRIYVEGKGKLENVRAEYSPNRRVEMRLLTAQEAEALRASAGDAQQSQASGAQAHSSGAGDRTPNLGKQSNAAGAASAQAAAVDETQVIATETVNGNTTLSRLARKYYGNTFCWVYIYAMNKSVIPNPNKLEAGQQLRIPKLSDVDKQITKQEAEQYIHMLR